jgi:hypothetical protein
LQPDPELMRSLSAAGLVPGASLHITATQRGVEVWDQGEHSSFEHAVTDHVFVLTS